MRMQPASLHEADALYEDACRLWTAARRRDAIERLDAALRLDPDAPHVLVMGGYMLGEMGKAEAAVRFYRRALLLDPRFTVAYANLGKLLVELRRPAEALEAFDAVIALKPADADAWNGRAGALRELGRLEELARRGAPCARVEARFPRGGDQLRQCAPETRPDGGSAAGLPPGQRRAARLRCGVMRRGAGAAQPRPLRRGARGLRGGRVARRLRGGRRQGLPAADARRFRARIRGLRGALAGGQVARRGAGRALSDLERTGARTEPRAGPQRSWLRR